MSAHPLFLKHVRPLFYTVFGLDIMLTLFFSSGHVISGLRVHPDREHLIYPLGSTVILKRIKDGKQEFLHGHTNNVSCISVSRSGLYIASGQINFMGFKVAVVLIHYSLCNVKLLVWLTQLNLQLPV